MRSRWRVRVWSIFMSSVMLIWIMLPASSLAIENNYTGNKISVGDGIDKINQRVMKEFKDKEYATFIVLLKEQTNTTKIAKEAEKQSQKQNLSSVKSLHAKRSAIVSALSTKALETQQHVKELLGKEKVMKRVKEFHSYYIVNALAVTGTKETVEKLAELPEVKSIIPNGVQKLSPIVPNQEKGAVSTESETTLEDDPSVEWNISHIGAPKAWEKGINGTGTVVASIDSGVDWRHPALQTKYRGYNPETPTKGTHEFNWYDPIYKIGEPVDSVGHGTHTMGTIVGQEADGKNKIGVAPGAKWISVRAFTDDGGEDRHILAAGEWVLAPKDKDGQPHPEMAPDVINNSWGGNPEYNEWFRPMVQAWIDAGIVPVFSAGNSSIFMANGPGTISAPGNYPEAIAVGATDSADKIASFSFRGPSPYGEIKPDLTAPGVSIRSSTPKGNYEGGWNGTSMAAPHVSGAVLLLRQLNRQMTVEQIKELLTFTSTPKTDEQYTESPNHAYGHGVLNVEAAVHSVINGLGEIHGQIKKVGIDAAPPTLEFDEQKTMYLGTDQHLFVRVKDNVSVNSVTLKIRQNGQNDWETIRAKRISGNHQEGVYEAVIEQDQLIGSKLRYYWIAEDFSGNSIESDIVDASILDGVTVGYRENFESYPSGWFSYGRHNEWQWGEPTFGPEKVASGTKVYATNLRGNYSTGANMTLQMPPILVPKEGAFMLFKQWYNMSYFDDLGSVLVSTDQKTWKSLAEIKSGKKEWHDQFVDLSNYSGQKVYVAFNLNIEGSVGMEGWYIDDLRLLSSGNFTEELQKTIENSNQENNSPLSNKTVALPKENIEYPSKVQAVPSSQTSGLPLNATVSIVETGRTVTASPENGEYKLLHPKGSYTVKAEAYGFASKTQMVTLDKDSKVEANFTLDPLPKGTIQGIITDQKTGNPIKDATVMVLEDAAIKPAKTDENGHYSLESYEGKYTVYVYAKGYHSYKIAADVKPKNILEANGALKPFIGTVSEIAYDDGTAETSFAFPTAGNAWAVKMAVPDGKEAAILGANLRFWNTLWPRPGGTNIEIAIYDSTGKNGMPGNRLAGPVKAEAIRDQNVWTNVDLSDLGVVVDDDFYIVYFQADDHPYAPSIATDKNSTWKGQSYQFLKGDQWYQTPKNEGNYMIRANVSMYDKDEPPIEDILTIEAPVDGSSTNQEVVKVVGKVQMEDLKAVEVNGQSANVNEDGSYDADISLHDGENEIKVIARSGSGRELTKSVTVFAKLNAPIIEKLKPDKDASYKVGQTVKVEFESESKLKSTFTIQISGIEDARLSDLQMEEVKKGYYVGYWKVPIDIIAKGATIEVKAEDNFGNETRKLAPGKLFINTKK
ncbi:S8 family serine peptidase [Heyndrickxia sporothermodurans]